MTDIDLLQAHLRGDHRHAAVEACPACQRLAAAPVKPRRGGRRKKDPILDQPQVWVGPEPPGKCQCGCGADVKNRFLPGHDAKLKSRLLRDGSERALAEMRRLGWGRFIKGD